MDVSGHEGDQMPIPMTSVFVGGHDSPPLHSHHHHHDHPSNGPAPPSEDHRSSCSTKNAAAIKYRECLKNHAVAIGGIATDGCGEFMPSGKEGTIEALKCSACGCHRNFHRKEAEGEEELEREPSPLEYLPSLSLRGRKGALLFPRVTTVPHRAMLMPFQYSSESSEMMATMRRPPQPHLPAKRRFRTKFTAEQKEKMTVFAEKVGWRLLREEEGLVQQFCQEIGVKRRVFKVWMHNNKHNSAKKNSADHS